MLNLQGIHHAAIVCSDYAVSNTFTEILGLRVGRELPCGRDSYKLDLVLPDGAQIRLFSFPIRPHDRRIRGPAVCGIGFSVTDVARCTAHN